jgi:dTDP-4-dehydrorhamnose reductase
MKVLLTGASGQIGRALQASAPSQVQFCAPGHPELDLTDEQSVSRVVAAFRPELIINAAAYTAVDRAESEAALAFAVNADGARRLALAARTIGHCRLLQLSTDYVFDGESPDPYGPAEGTNPLSVYGRSKRAGEQAVQTVLGARGAILRTAWVYAAQGRNFVLTMLRLMRAEGRVRVIADQTGTPTAASSIAAALWALAARPEVSGILHWTDGGTATWYDFAVAIAEEAHAVGLLTQPVEVVRISTADYPTAARRPRHSVLDTQASIDALGITPRHWRMELHALIKSLQQA